jgi:TRAP-type C4-dicarboxylate transport system permease small subunit
MQPSSEKAPTGGLALVYAGLVKIEAFTCFLALTLGTLALFADIVGREILGQGIFGAQRTAVYCMAVAGVLGFSYVVSQGGHLRPTVIDKLLPASLDFTMSRVGDFVSGVICCGLAYAAFLFVRGTFEIGEYSMTLPIPIWTVQIILPIAFGLAGFKYFLFVLAPGLRPQEASSEL